MIQTCADCPEWAQWILIWPQAQSVKPETTTYKDGLHQEEKTKTLVPRGRTYEVGPHLCQVHKELREKQPSEREQLFRFIGAKPARLA